MENTNKKNEAAVALGKLRQAKKPTPKEVLIEMSKKAKEGRDRYWENYRRNKQSTS